MKTSNQTTTKFSSKNQFRFSDLSGDFNPIHHDPSYARRSMFGTIVVHGMHAVLKAMDVVLKNENMELMLESLNTIFINPIPVDQEIILSIERQDTYKSKIDIRSDELVLIRVKLRFRRNINTLESNLPIAYTHPNICRNPSKNEIMHSSGKLDLYFDRQLCANLFPNLIRKLSHCQIAELLSITRLIGMICPGLNSLLSGLDLNFRPILSEEQPSLHYNVQDYDDRFSRLLMHVHSVDMEGVVKAYIRPSPINQPCCEDLSIIVDAGEFDNQQALIVGGSRGLGEIAAKLLSMGGADILLTYYQSKKSAVEVASDISENGGNVKIVRFDAVGIYCEHFKRELHEWKLTHLYYFATPKIFDGRRGVFSEKLFDKFCNYYVKGFKRTIELVLQTSSSELRVLYPSTIAIDQLQTNLGEYTAAKIAGEQVSAFMTKTISGLHIITPRLHRMRTDQTMSLIPVENKNPVDCLLKELRYINKI